MAQILSAIEHLPKDGRIGHARSIPLQDFSARSPTPQSASIAARSSNDDDRAMVAVPPAAPVVVTEASRTQKFLPKSRAVIVIATLSGVSLLSSVSTGILTIGLPRMAIDVGLEEHLLLWPASVYALTTGSCLLLAGSIADVIGHRIVNLTGCLIVGVFMLACGFARTGIELIMFRALHGIALSLCLPTSVAIVANAVPTGRPRNIGFACLGFVMPLGFSLGLVLGGVLLDTIGWRFGYYLCGALTLLLFVVSTWALPADKPVEGGNLKKLKTDIDWVGAALASTCLALFSYVLATLTDSLSSIRQPGVIVMTVLSLLLIPIFIFWQRKQERAQKPALMPSSLWKNKDFTTVCLMVIMSFAMVNTMEFFSSLFFQRVQNLSALDASLRILPSLIIGIICQVMTGFLVHRVSAFHLVLGSLILSTVGPLLMAVIDASAPYWYNAFFAQLLSPLSTDILFTIGLLVVSDVFPTETQALAGAIFNTVAQFGNSIGLTITSVVSSSATMQSPIRDKTSAGALEVGYKAGFWAAFAWMVLACIIGFFGLRKIGRVGLKRD